VHDDTIDVKLLTGRWVSTREFADRLRQLQAQTEPSDSSEGEDVEFLQPNVPGRYTLAAGSKPEDDED
jgi:hypothetical protein